MSNKGGKRLGSGRREYPEKLLSISVKIDEGFLRLIDNQTEQTFKRNELIKFSLLRFLIDSESDCFVVVTDEGLTIEDVKNGDILKILKIDGLHYSCERISDGKIFSKIDVESTTKWPTDYEGAKKWSEWTKK